MIAIRPGLFDNLIKRFDKTHIKSYISSIRNEELENQILETLET